MVLAPPAHDLSHPAFSNLFVQTQLVRDRQAILCTRRPRSSEEKPPWTVVADKHPRNKASMGDKYGIRGIPAFVLIGQDGKVATVNCRGQALGKNLEKLLGKGAAK